MTFLQTLRKHRHPYIFIAPTIILLVTFSILPILVSLVVSFTNMNLKGLKDFSTIKFVGFDQYIQVFQDEAFLKAMYNTFFYVIIGVPLVVICSLLVALLLNTGSNKLYQISRMLYYAPAVTNIVAVSVVWLFLYNSSYGLFNQMLGFFGVEPIKWLLDPQIAKISLIIMAVWKGIGINMLIFLVALKEIPPSYYEAASIDGASSFARFRFITLPSLRFSTFFVSITTIIGWIQFFEEPFVMTQGGPLQSTKSMALLIYENGFKQSKFGYAAAGSMILFVIIFVVTFIQFKIQKEQ